MLLVSRVVAGPPQMRWYETGGRKGRGGEQAGVGQARNRCREIGTIQAAHDEHVNSIRVCVFSQQRIY